MVLGAAVGPMRLTAGEVVRGALGAVGIVDADPVLASVVGSIRVPRVVLGALVGAALAASGVAMQALFRNPLADAGLLGVSSGGALGSALVIVLLGDAVDSLPPALAPAARPLAAFAGGLAATLIVLRIGRSEVDGEGSERGDVAVMLLAGIALNALVGSILGLLSHVAGDAELRDVTFWTLGNLGAASWRVTVATAVPMLACPLALVLVARRLDVYQLGPAEARHLGVRTDRLVRILVATTALSVGASVAAAGLLGFVGLVVPHLVRLLVGPSHRSLARCAPLAGALLLVVADTAARVVARPSELPVGVLTAGLGAPFFLALVVRELRGARRLA